MAWGESILVKKLDDAMDVAVYRHVLVAHIDWPAVVSVLFAGCWNISRTKNEEKKNEK